MMMMMITLKATSRMRLLCLYGAAGAELQDVADVTGFIARPNEHGHVVVAQLLQLHKYSAMHYALEIHTTIS